MYKRWATSKIAAILSRVTTAMPTQFEPNRAVESLSDWFGVDEGKIVEVGDNHVGATEAVGVETSTGIVRVCVSVQPLVLPTKTLSAE